MDPCPLASVTLALHHQHTSTHPRPPGVPCRSLLGTIKTADKLYPKGVHTVLHKANGTDAYPRRCEEALACPHGRWLEG